MDNPFSARLRAMGNQAADAKRSLVDQLKAGAAATRPYVEGASPYGAGLPLAALNYVSPPPAPMQPAPDQGPPMPGVSAEPEPMPPPVSPPMMGGGGGGPPPTPVEVSRVGPTVRAGHEQANASAERAINENQALRQEQADKERQFYERSADDQRIADLEGERREKDRQEQARAYQEHYVAYANEVANDKVDQGRVWANKSTLEKVGSILQRAARGFLIGSGRGDIGDQLQREIDQDIEVQKANIANRRNTLDAKRGAYWMALQRFGNERAAEHAAKAALIDTMKTRLGAIAAESQSTQVKQRANDARARLDGMRAEQLDKMTAYIVPGAAGGGGGGRAAPKDEKVDEKAVQWLASKEADLDLPGTQTRVDTVLSQIPEKGDIPGVGPLADRLYARSASGGLTGALAGEAFKRAYGEQGLKVQQDVAAIENDLRRQLTGASASPQEMANFERARGGVRDAQSLRNWIQGTMAVVNAKRQGIRAGVRPEVAAEYDRRRAAQAAPPPPDYFKPAGAR